ncbi:MAG: gamma-glutamylcyclotransferase [Hoeflea sp.]|uniref:gamma-glutamylcyclotransferase n=1 Tax=Hoeflea sp. TaxID=1940281 RepID=UPI001D25BD3B|nr:gamma-glutamylcyclotransferase [Hoeflea sp.]MBU4531514.1 gamma-glutamylcyclotransferase [Alphaproteobacteria bacterium]MBU4544371.1 gamma-glutamylcyclotransferase [Alphaproteobacteria bacterium]MBU4550392.1 gamma-glutamylcyclotransferase [Alphaproteobacteria bacterium]MBV1724790.1 gamma-glutamylcyclotransferase [Hoeflea sp.]MBV1760810.1 gamma-glutamylcyclotransferase [Hoeflea sp.]
MKGTKRMRLTRRHVDLVHRPIDDPGPKLLPGFRAATDADYAEAVDGMLASCPGDEFWLFGYGSLIWRPETAFEEKRLAHAIGWHRRFCLGPDYRYRGSHDRPGLMMALDRGGQCTGMVYRLPQEGLEAELHRLIRRELSQLPSAFPWRWISVRTDHGALKALTFAMDRRSPRYVAGLPDEEIAQVLASACGFRGSMAEYLFSTITMLESLGIHDRNLWRLQSLVAERIEAECGLANTPPDHTAG